MINISIKKPLLILVVFTVLTLCGLICYNSLNLNLLPKFEVKTITIQMIYPGAGASEVEASVTKKLEDALSTLENLKKINSVSMENISVIAIELTDAADVNRAVQDAQRLIGAIKSQLPQEVLDPSINKLSSDDQPILNIATSATMPAAQFFKLVENRIQPRLAKISGVGSVQITGGTEREIKVNMDEQKLKAYNLSPLQVLQAVRISNLEVPAGNVEDDRAIYSVRFMAKFNDLNEIRNTVVAISRTGGKIKVMDVADVEDGTATQQIINRIDEQDAIGIAIRKQSDANAVNVADLVKAELAAMEKEYANNHLKFDVATDDSVFTRATANAVVEDLFLAILIVTFVCFIFLHNLRSALIVMIAVPLSIIPAFIVMYVLGFTLNLMSLMALSLVVGILVDDSIVVIENMFRHLEEGKTKREAALDGARQIVFTCMAITFVIVVVFFPLAIASGMIGNIVKEFAIPVIVATLCSLLVSFTVTPLLMSRFGKLSDTTSSTISSSFSRGVEKSFESVKNVYVKILAGSLRHKTLILLAAFVLFIASLSLVPNGFIGINFIPSADTGDIEATIDMNPQMSIYQNNLITMQVERIIRQHPEVARIYTNVGLSGDRAKNNFTFINIKLVNKKKRTISAEDFSQVLKADLMKIPGIRARVAPKAFVGGRAGDAVQLIVLGADYEQVQETASKILDVVRRTPGTADARLSIDDPRQEVQIRLDRDKISTLGLSAADIGATLRIALNGNDDVKYDEGDFEYRIRVGIDNFDRTRADDVAKLTVLNRAGQLIELSQFADISYGLGPTALERTDRIPSITVKSNVFGRAAGTVGSEITKAISGIIPEGIAIMQAGMMEMQRDAFGTLGFAFLAAIVLIYLIMVVLYNSLSNPLVVLFSIPLSLIGAFIALALSMSTMNILSIVGLIVLIGLVAKNAILLVDFTNQARKRGMDTTSALIEAGKERLRPILMTTFAMIFGMMPIALASGDGAEIKNGMAWVIIGGLTSSMLLTLVVVPIVYYIFDKISSRFSRE
ncbi:RND efflux transporter [Fibrobacteria bacterium R8-3-H12]